MAQENCVDEDSVSMKGLTPTSAQVPEFWKCFTAPSKWSGQRDMIELLSHPPITVNSHEALRYISESLGQTWIRRRQRSDATRLLTVFDMRLTEG
jgi:hypothetical protein